MLSPQVIELLGEHIGRNRALILSVADTIWSHPETGYREWKTSAYMEGTFRSLGYHPVTMGNIPGFYADLDTGRPGPTLAVIGELDSILCPSHPQADPVTGAVHACGHHTQCANLVGAAAVLREASQELSGKIRFIAAPAEELIELDFRAQLKKDSIIKYFAGKDELMYRGVFDDVDAAIMIHSGLVHNTTLIFTPGMNGLMAKHITYIGKAAHAGGAPHLGINAIYAASLGLQAVNSIRETFIEANYTRVHPIITEGGAAINVIPDTARIETFVRGASPQAIVSENKKINRALAGAALCMGARIKVDDHLTYMPLENEPGMRALAQEVGVAMLGRGSVGEFDSWSSGTTDMGNLSCVMPVLQPYAGGGAGTDHGDDYRVADTEVACIDSTRFITGMAYALLQNSACALCEIKSGFKPRFQSREEYFQFLDRFTTSRELIAYLDDGASVVW